MMSEWQTVVLGDIATLRNGYAFKSSDFVEHGVPIIKIKNVKPNRINLDNLSYVSEEVAESTAKHEIQSDEILLTMSGNRADGSPESWVGKAAKFRVPGRFLLNQRVSALRAKEEIADVDFLAYHLSSWDTQLALINQANSSGGQANISPDTVRSLEVELPPLPEQKAIADVLISLDHKIDLLHRQNKTLEAMAETLFRQWFVEDASEDWPKFDLGELCQIKIGRTPPRKEFHWFSTDAEDVKWISIKDLATSGTFILDTAEKLTAEALEAFRIPVIPESTLVLSFKMTVGRVAITTERMISNEAIAHFLIENKLAVSIEFLYFYLKLFPYQTLGSTSSIVTSINSRMIRELPVFLPPSEMISQFTSEISSSFRRILANQRQIGTLEQLRDTLLPKLMSGEVRVSR
ncbi:restriction endonuclease subunit S [Rhodopirellula europaea]|uniref:Type I restriction-modification system, subunit S n=1 Tax=Rhodopirellula europaea SH398 TaxID=1263868 RepID=M5S0G1_9BACT|nr:restriction endonuclease subunit S [Rhodopirellula europaea]EMI25093.1 type I restriction-modification system, subunit S [Rhodopirellula europaea SH398]